MMRISTAFPSNYLRAADLQGRNVKVVMDRVEMEEIGGDPKPVLYFQGKDKGMVLNKTNAGNITMGYGDDTDGWTGREVVLFPAMVDFQGRTVEAIRVRIPPKSNISTAPQRMAEQSLPNQNGGGPSDEIPF